MKKINIWIAVSIITFTSAILVGASEQICNEGEGCPQPTKLSLEPLQEPYVQILESTVTIQSDYTVTVSPNASDFPNILLTVSVRDMDGYSVGGLTANDFRVFEQSTTESARVIQELTCFLETVSDDSGNAFAIAVDVSASISDDKLKETKTLIGEFIANSLETDQMSLISFSNGGTESIVLPLNDVNSDSDSDGTVDMVEAANGLTTLDRTALFDGTAMAIESLDQGPSHKAVIVFSDGKSNDDQSYDINSLIEKANNSGVMVFTIVLGDSSSTMENIAQLTGGKCYYASTGLDMSEIYYDIAATLQTEFTYTLCYTTHNTAMDGTTRTVSVQYGPGEGTGFYTVNFAPIITRDGATQQFDDHSQPQGVTLTISGDITDTDAATDPEQTIAAELFYRQIGSTVYSAQSLTLDGGENGVYAFSEAIPAEQVLAPGIEYYLYASDGMGETFAPVSYEIQPYSIQVLVPEPELPTANAGSDMSALERSLVTLDGTGSAAPDQDIADTLAYEWTQVEGSSVELANASGQQATFTAPQVGPQGSDLVFMLTVTDTGGGESTDTVTISVTDSTPTSAFTWNPETPTAGNPVTFTDISTAPGDEIVSRVWVFGGEGGGEGKTPTFTFEEQGNYSVTLTVTDSDGSTDTLTRSITIARSSIAEEEACPNGDCDPGGGCFISELLPQKENSATDMHTSFAVLCCTLFGAMIIHVLKKWIPGSRKNRIRFTLFKSAFLMILLLAVSGNVQADEIGDPFVRPGAFTVSPMVGGFMFDSSQDIEEGPVFGLGLGYNFTENWALRLYGHFGEFDHPYWDSDTCGCVEEDVSASVLQADLVYHLWPSNRFVPYLAAGAGYMDLDFDSIGGDSSSTLNYGGGIKYFLNRNLAIKANIRHIYWIDDSKSNLMANVGLEFQFGGSKPKPAPTPEPAPVPVPVEESPKPEMLEAPPAVKPEPETLVLRIKFKFDDATVDPAYHDEFEKVVQFLNKHLGVNAVIEGHTCNIGPEAYNMDLSRRRAESVRAYLIQNFNVGGERLSTVGYGEARSDYDNSTLEGRRQNRRVVIRLEEE